MRNLTFGVLIVFVGFVAALPFRKTPPAGQGEAGATLATGPSNGLIATNDSVSFDPLVVRGNDSSGSSVGPADMSGMHPRPTTSPSGLVVSNAYSPRRLHSTSVPGALAAKAVPPQLSARIPSDAVASPRRDLRLPLTYDDLAVPLVTPQYSRERFNALAVSPQRQSNTGQDQPDRPNTDQFGTAFESMAITNARQLMESPESPFEQFDTQPRSILQDTPEQIAASDSGNRVGEVEKPQVEGRLASDTRPTSRSAKTEPEADTRKRHWIRQPE